MNFDEIAKQPGMLVRRKFRWFAKLFKEGKQVNEEEPVRVSRRPPLTITAKDNTGHIHQGGGEMMLTFMRTGIPWDCDEIVLSVIGGNDQLIEQWELCEVKRYPVNLFTSHIPGDEPFEDQEDEETMRFKFGHMRYRRPDGTWDTFSVL